MAKAALPSLAASLLLHLALSLGVAVPALRVSRAPLLASRPTELELVPLESAPPAQAPLAAPAAGMTESPPVVERAPSRRSAALPAKPSAPPVPSAAVASEPPSAEPPSAVSPSAVSPSAVSEVAAEPAPSAVQAPSFSVAAASVAESSAAPPGVAPESSSTARGTLARSGAGARDAAAAGGTGRPSASDGDADRALRAAYLRELRRRVLGHRVYPYLARRARLEGTVCLRVSLNGQGQVARLQVTCAAPAPLLDAAFAAVRTAAPFGPLPSQLGGALTVDIPVVFQLESL